MQRPETATGEAGGTEAASSGAPMIYAKRFLPLFLVQALGAFNDNVFKNAFVALLTFKLAGELGLVEQEIGALVAVAAAVFILPFAMFAPLAGQIADRLDKATMMRGVKAVEILLMIAAAIGYHLQNIAFLYVLLFLMGAQSAFFAPIKYGVLPRYLPDDELVQGNGLVQAGTFLSILLGTIAGIQLIRTDSGILLVSVAVITISILGFVASLYAPPAPPAAEDKAHLLPNLGARFLPENNAQWLGAAIFLGIGAALAWAVLSLLGAESFFYPARFALAGLGFLFGVALYVLWPSIVAAVDAARERPVVLRTILAISWFWFAAAGFMSVMPVLVSETLRGDEDVYTLLLAAFSIGVAVGASLVSKLQQGRIQVGVAPWGALGIAVFAIDIYLALAGGGVAAGGEEARGLGELLSSFLGWRVLLDFVGLAICAGLFVTPLNAIYQHHAPPEALGRVVSASNMIDSAVMATSSVVVILLQTGFGMGQPAVLATLGATGLITAVIVARWSPETMIGRTVLSLLPRRGGA